MLCGSVHQVQAVRPADLLGRRPPKRQERSAKQRRRPGPCRRSSAGPSRGRVPAAPSRPGHRGCAPAGSRRRPRVRAPRSAPGGPTPPGRRPCRPRPPRPRQSTPRPASCSAARAATSAEPVLQLVVDDHGATGRTPRGRRRTPSPRRAPASRRHRRPPTTTRLPGPRSASALRTRLRPVATAGSSAPPMSAELSRARGRPTTTGRGSRTWSGRLAGSAHTALKPGEPDLGVDLADELGAVAVLAHLGVEPQQPAEQAVERTGALAALGELAPDLGDARDDLRPDAVHHDVGVALEQRHDAGQLVDDLALPVVLEQLGERGLGVAAGDADRPRRARRTPATRAPTRRGRSPRRTRRAASACGRASSRPR